MPKIFDPKIIQDNWKELSDLLPPISEDFDDRACVEAIPEFVQILKFARRVKQLRDTGAYSLKWAHAIENLCSSVNHIDQLHGTEVEE